MTMMEAEDLLPKEARWSCSFGCPGNGGYVEYYRTPAGERWTLWNHPDNASEWHCEPAVS